MKKQTIPAIAVERAAWTTTLERAIPVIVMALAIFLAASSAHAGGRDRDRTRHGINNPGGVVSGALVAEGLRVGYGGGNLHVSIGRPADRHGRYSARPGFGRRGWHRRGHGGFWRIERVWVPVVSKGRRWAKHDGRRGDRGHRHGGKRRGSGHRGQWSERRVWVSY